MLVSVNKDVVALLCAELGNPLHEDCVVGPREAYREEAGLEAWMGLKTHIRSIVGIFNSTILLSLTIREEKHSDLLDVAIYLKKSFNFVKDAQIDFWTGASACLDRIDPLPVGLLVGDFEFRSVAMSPV